MVHSARAMKTVLIIGAGGVGHVVAHKCAQMSDVYESIHLASRTKSKCDAIAADVLAREGVTITTHAVDADDVAATVALIKEVKPDLVLNVALPYQDLPLMDACLEAGGQVISIVADSLQKQPLVQNVLWLSLDDFDQAFSSQRALHRNHVIHTLAELTIVAQCTLGKGGTWDGILHNLKNGWNSVCI